MLNIYIIVVTAVFLAFCTAVLLHQAIYSFYFRKKIALPHGFSEGIMAGFLYPMLWIIYGLIAVQFISFIAFRDSSELFLTLRLIVFAISILAFCIFKTLTPPLLALWFGKSAFWDNKGDQGKHQLSDIYCAKVHKDKNSHVINNQQLYKITFYVKGKTAFLFPKKYSCKMTAKQIGNLTTIISFKERDAKPEIKKKALLYGICLPMLVFFITLFCFFHVVSTGALNTEKYVSSNTPLETEISTVTEIYDAKYDGERIYVFYNKIGAVNVYTPNGEFLYAISLPHSIFKHTEIAVSESKLLYHYGDEVISYSANGEFIEAVPYTEEHNAVFSATPENDSLSYGKGGVRLNTETETINIVVRPAYLSVFSASVIWPINMLLILALFMLRYYVFKEDSKSKV